MHHIKHITIRMFSATTFGITVTVLPEYDPHISFPSENRYGFRYHITVENRSGAPVKILRRRWLITDLGFGISAVEGDGVIGLTPEIEAGSLFRYFSNVILESGVGSMEGEFICENLLTRKIVTVQVPRFSLFSKVLCN